MPHKHYIRHFERLLPGRETTGGGTTTGTTDHYVTNNYAAYTTYTANDTTGTSGAAGTGGTVTSGETQTNGGEVLGVSREDEPTMQVLGATRATGATGTTAPLTGDNNHVWFYAIAMLL